MSNQLSDEVAIVTGAASGIGRRIARTFAEEGASVVVADVRETPREGGTPTHELIRGDGGEAAFVETDVTSPESIRATVEGTVEEFGSLDAMVNNAGWRRVIRFLETTEEEYRRHIDVNLTGTYFGCQAAIAAMEEGDGGSVVNLSSIAGLTGTVGRSAYAAAKAGISNLTRVLAIEHGSSGIRVNAICPGVTRTAMTTDDADAVSEMEDFVPLGRVGEPEDVANAALFLASDRAAYVTGHNLVVDGGITASPVS